VYEVIDRINWLLANSSGDPAYREGMIEIGQTILHNTNNYMGFRYLGIKEVPEGQKPGIRHAPNGDMLPYEERFQNTDQTRICFSMNERLRKEK
jgi:hypothetical protein